MAKVRRDAGCGNPKKLVFCPWRATNLFAAAVRTQMIKTLYPHKLVLSCDGFHRIFALQMLRMFKKMKKLILFLFAMMFLSLSAFAQSRLTVGGYGEVALTRNFYSDNVYRYSSASAHAGESHGRFDIPHAVIYLGYDFGKGWTMQSEIEFEHTGTGVATEREFEEAGEWEKEVEKGGEVELEQFWIQKAFLPQLNVRMGHIVVPVGGLNNAHEPLNFFTVYRPEGESTILPSTWHDTGISIWGQAGAWRYEAQFLAGLDALMFTRDNWIKNGPKSAFEYKVANQYGAALRIDNTSVRNLRLSLSGYAGNSMRNTYPNEALSERYDVKGTVPGTLSGRPRCSFRWAQPSASRSCCRFPKRSHFRVRHGSRRRCWPLPASLPSRTGTGISRPCSGWRPLCPGRTGTGSWPRPKRSLNHPVSMWFTGI